MRERRQRRRKLEASLRPLPVRQNDGDASRAQGDERRDGAREGGEQPGHTNGNNALPTHEGPSFDPDHDLYQQLCGYTQQLVEEVEVCGHGGPFHMGTLSFRFIRKYRKGRWPAGRFLFLPCANKNISGQEQRLEGEQQQIVPVPVSDKPSELDTEDIHYSVLFTGDSSRVHQVFCEFIDRKLNGTASTLSRHLRYRAGEARNVALTHMGVSTGQTQQSYREPRAWRYDPSEGAGIMDSSRNVLAPVQMVFGLDSPGSEQIVSQSGTGVKEPDVLILDEHRPLVPLMAIEIVYKNESVLGIIYSLSIWTQQCRSAHVPSSVHPKTRATPCHALALHVADAPEFRLDPRYPAFAWAEAYSAEPGRDSTRDGFHGNVLVMNASPAFCKMWKDTLAEECCPLRLLFVGNSDVFELPILLRAPSEEGQEGRYVQLSWDLTDLAFLYHEGKFMDNLELPHLRLQAPSVPFVPAQLR